MAMSDELYDWSGLFNTGLLTKQFWGLYLVVTAIFELVI
jgi:hypothetical protein